MSCVQSQDLRPFIDPSLLSLDSLVALFGVSVMCRVQCAPQKLVVFFRFSLYCWTCFSEMKNIAFMRNHCFFVYLFVFIKCLLYLLGKHVAAYVFLFSPHWANSIQEHGEKSEQPRVDRKGTLPMFRCARNARNARNDRSARSSRNGRKAEHYQHNLKLLDVRTEHYIAAAGKQL